MLDYFPSCRSLEAGSIPEAVNKRSKIRWGGWSWEKNPWFYWWAVQVSNLRPSAC